MNQNVDLSIATGISCVYSSSLPFQGKPRILKRNFDQIRSSKRDQYLRDWSPISEIYWSLKFGEKKSQFRIDFLQKRSISSYPLLCMNIWTYMLAFSNRWTRLTQRGLRKKQNVYISQTKTGLYGGIKVQLIAHKNEPTLLAMDQHRAAKNEKRVPLWRRKNTFQQLQWWKDGMNDMTRAECKSCT